MGRAESVCVHSDTPDAVSVAKAVRSALAGYLGKAV
jgi:lactam utilization protein B